MQLEATRPVFESWAIVELMGHVRLGAFVREATLAGVGMLRLELPDPETPDALRTMYVAPGSLYRLTPVTEEVARVVAARNQPEVIRPWEMPRPEPVAPRALVAHQEAYDDSVDDDYDEDQEEGELGL